MDYREAMQMLSQCGLGVLVADADERIIEANDAAEQLLQDEGKLEGRLLADIAPAFCRGRRDRLMPIRHLANIGGFARHPQLRDCRQTAGCSYSGMRQTMSVMRC